MARRKSRRAKSWRAVVKKHRGDFKAAAREWRGKGRKHRKAKGRKRSNPKGRGLRRGHRKGLRSRKFLHNPIAIGGRKGRFEIIPSLNTLKGAAVRGVGAVASDVVRATGYSLMGRVSGSLAEDALGRLVAGALTGAAAGYLFGPAIGAAVVEGSYTVALYKVIADAAAKATGGKPKLFGFIANPFTEVPAKPFLPAFGATAGALPAETAEEAMSGLSAYTPEGDVVPLGAVVPEGDVVPLGLDEEEPARFRARL